MSTEKPLMNLTCLSVDLRKKLELSKVLVVGAGGIGCELLKNLVFTGFLHIEVIDLDTIDVSNLNRQFLFQRQHVGQAKAQVAKETCLKFVPHVTINAHCANIMNKEYGISYFSQFGLVLNALDNQAARAHVNRMCLGAQVPLIESGTSGFKGQVELIYRGLTLCYECTPKEAPKTFPACTIRTTPTEHIHCIIWSKYLFTSLFGGASEDEEDVATVSTENGDGDGSGDKSTVEKKKPISPKQWAIETGYDPEKLFNKLFYDDIKYNLLMKDLWVSRKPPVPLSWDTEIEDNSTDSALGSSDQRVWSIPECKQIFAQALKSLKEDSEKLGEGENLVWDKDDEPAMNFVAATANIRAHVYGIQLKSKFEIKAMAGNIIPAIATSNACIAGLMVLFALKVIDNKMEHCKTVYLQETPSSRGVLIAPETVLSPRNPNCFVCSSKSIALFTDISKLTVRELENVVLKGRLSMVEPEVMLDLRVIISSEEGETCVSDSRTLQEIGIISGSLLRVEDFVQDYEIKIVVIHKELTEEEGKFVISGDFDSMKQATKDLTSKPATNGEPKASTSGTSLQAQDDDDDDIAIIHVGPSTSDSEGSQKRPAEETPTIPVKKRKTQNDDDDCLIID